MPHYKSTTGKDVLIKIGKNKREVKITPLAQYFPYDNLHLQFPDHISRVETIDEIIRKEIIRQTPQIIKEYYLEDSLPTGSWTGEQCFIIGGGPSLKGFDFSKLKDERVIAINKAFVAAPFAEIAFSVDRRFQEWVINGGENMETAKKEWPNFEGHKVWLKVPGESYLPDIEFIKYAGHEGLSLSLEEGIYDGSNSGYAAINLAIALGANPIYLLGFDMKHNKDGDSHYHEGYPVAQEQAQLNLFAKKFPFLANLAEFKGIRIINLNKDSALNCFEFGDLPELGPKKYSKKWVVVSFYTVGTGYEQEIESLRQSLEHFEIDYHFFPHEPQGTWRKNLNYKSKCILEAFDMFPDQDIVFIDADGIVRQYPILFDNLSQNKHHDVAATFHRYSPQSGDIDELLSGTLWFPNNKRGRRLVTKWHEVGLVRQDIRHQKCLRVAIEELRNNNIEVNVCRMPFEYTYVFDYKYPTKRKPIIEHFQASRRFRKEVGYGANLIKNDADIAINNILQKSSVPEKQVNPTFKKKGITISVVVVSYRRLETLEQVLSVWLKQTNDVWLCDCSKEGFITDLPIKIIRAIPDPGNKIRHAVATMTSGDLVIKADDDIIPKDGLIADFVKCYQELGDCIMGIHGRTFNGFDYYRDTVMLTGRDVAVTTKVDFLGIITCSPRKYLAMDLRGCESEVEDLFWHNHKYPKIPKYVIPTENFEYLPSSKDHKRLCGNLQFRKNRQDFYSNCYKRFYK